MSVTLYKLDPSPPARAAMMGCEIFNVPVQMVDVNVLTGEHRQADFLQKNPIHSIPVMAVDDLVIHDSHAILMYLADVYGKDDSMYPKDTKKRTKVNQKLFFNATILFPRLRNVTYPLLVEGIPSKGPNEKQQKDIEEAYDILERFLSQSKFLAADNITIADISAFATVTSLGHLLPLNMAKYPKVQAWIEAMEQQSYSKKFNAPGVAILGQVYKSKLSS